MTTTEIKQRIAELDGDIKPLQVKIDRFNSEKRDLISQYWALEYGCRLGAIVVSEGSEYRVDSIVYIWGLSRPWIKANPKKKDGTWGTTLRSLFSNWVVKA